MPNGLTLVGAASPVKRAAIVRAFGDAAKRLPDDDVELLAACGPHGAGSRRAVAILTDGYETVARRLAELGDELGKASLAKFKRLMKRAERDF